MEQQSGYNVRRVHRVNLSVVTKHDLIFATIAMITLYFKKELIVMFGITVNAGYILMYLVQPHSLLSDNIQLKELITVITIINCNLCLLYFLTKWGNELVEKSLAKEQEAKEFFTKLEQTFNTIDDGVVSLYQKINTVDTQLKGVNSASRGIVDSVQQMAAAIQEEATSVYKINKSMTESLQVRKWLVPAKKDSAGWIIYLANL